MFLPGDAHEDSNGASSLSFFVLLSSPVDSIQALWIIFFSSFQMPSHTGAPHNHSLLAIHLFWSAEDISEDSRFHSRFVQVISRFLSYSSHLIQLAQSIF